MFGIGKKIQMPDESEALPGRSDSMPVADVNRVTLNSMTPPFPSSHEQLVVGMGCFWGVERLFYSQPGIWTTAVGYSAGLTPNPTYEEVCSGLTGHNEVVLIVYDPSIMATEQLLSLFWENHDPTQGMRQGPDRGTQYRSGIYTFSQEQMDQAVASRDAYQQSLAEAGFGTVTTEILSAPEFYYAEDYHQQYLHKNPAGYCSMRGTGVQCAAPVASVVE